MCRAAVWWLKPPPEGAPPPLTLTDIREHCPLPITIRSDTPLHSHAAYKVRPIAAIVKRTEHDVHPLSRPGELNKRAAI